MNVVADSSCDEYRVDLSSPGHKSETILRGLRRFDPSLAAPTLAHAVSEIMPRRTCVTTLEEFMLKPISAAHVLHTPLVGARVCAAR